MAKWISTPKKSKNFVRKLQKIISHEKIILKKSPPNQEESRPPKKFFYNKFYTRKKSDKNPDFYTEISKKIVISWQISIVKNQIIYFNNLIIPKEKFQNRKNKMFKNWNFKKNLKLNLKKDNYEKKFFHEKISLLDKKNKV